VVLGISIALLVGVVVLFVFAIGGFFGIGPRPLPGAWAGFLLVFLLLWIAFFAMRVVFWTRRGYGGYGGYGGPRRYRDPAMMIARQRYARGEITREQFDQIVSDLERRGRGPAGPLSGS
jgi:putative membrane protein